MTKREVKSLIIIKVTGSCKKAEYLDMNCGTYTKSWTNTEIKEDVYKELKERELI